MPVITLQRERFSRFVGRDLTVEKMTEWLPWVGFDIEDIGSDYVKVEFNPNRVDLCSYAGVARAFKGLMGWETGLPEYKVQDGKILLSIAKAVSRIRPYMLAGVVRNIKLDEDDVTDIMEMQEDLHWGIGRDRKKASIGVHNLDAVNPPFTFTAVEPDEAKFVPLDTAEEMSLREILEDHEKGIAYKHLVDWAPRYPLLVDRDGKVLSMPPIINGELTRITSKTTTLFLDVTGTDFVAVERCLDILATALSDMGGVLEKVTVKSPDRTIVSPILAPQHMKLRVDYANELLGLKLAETQIIESLKKSRLDAKEKGKGVVQVAIPAYRIDVLHEVDLVEEVAIGYGYYRLKPTIPERLTVGAQHQVHQYASIVRQIMVGLGFTEVVNFTLTNQTLHYEKMRLRAHDTIRLTNPVSLEYTILRQSLLPNLMKNLADNRHESFPQHLFEASDVGLINPRAETKVERRLHAAAVSSHSTANFTEIKSFVEALLYNAGVRDWEIKPTNHMSYLEGRAATVVLKRKKIGMLGEIHPEVLNNFELENPTSAFEIDVEALL